MLTSYFISEKLNRRNEASNLILYSLGSLVSIFGTSIYTFAIGLYVLKITGSGLSFATTLVLGIIPKIILLPFAGVLADRLDKKTMVVLMDILNGMLFISVYLLSSIYGLSLSMIFISTFIMNVITCFFEVSFSAAIPNLVTERMLMNINSVSRIINSFSSILGPMIGGMVYAFMDIRTFIIINGISFIFSGISEMFINFKLNCTEVGADKSSAKVNFKKDILDGFKYLVGNKSLIGLFSTFVTLNFCIGFSATVPLPFIINNVLKLNPADFGIIEGAFPAGIILGALIVKKISERVTYNKILIATSCTLALCMVLIGIPTMVSSIKLSDIWYLVYYCVIMGVFGIAISLIDIPIAYIMQKSIPDEFRGRVMSIAVSLGKIIAPLALVISGFVINRIPAFEITSLGGILLMAFTGLTLRAGVSRNSKVEIDK